MSTLNIVLDCWIILIVLGVLAGVDISRRFHNNPTMNRFLRKLWGPEFLVILKRLEKVQKSTMLFGLVTFATFIGPLFIIGWFQVIIFELKVWLRGRKRNQRRVLSQFVVASQN